MGMIGGVDEYQAIGDPAGLLYTVSRIVCNHRTNRHIVNNDWCRLVEYTPAIHIKGHPPYLLATKRQTSRDQRNREVFIGYYSSHQ